MSLLSSKTKHNNSGLSKWYHEAGYQLVELTLAFSLEMRVCSSEAGRVNTNDQSQRHDGES